MPGKKNSGTSTSTTMTVAITIPERTSSVALAINSSGPRRLLGCAARSIFSRRSTFSTPTTASSTSSPIAIVSPPNVMVLIDRSKYLNTSTVTMNEIGIATSEISVVRTLAKKKYKTTATTTNASMSLLFKLFTDDSIKLAWRMVTCASPMPAGCPFFNSCSAAST